MRSQILFVGLILPVLLLTHTRAQSPAVLNTAAADGDAQRKAAEERIKQMQNLVLALTEKHGYQLAEGEPFKYIKDPPNEERIELRRLMRSARPGSGLASKEAAEGFRLFMHVFYMLPDGRLVSSSTSDGVTTLGDVFKHVLKLKRHEFQCSPNLLMTYAPGDWVLPADRENRPVMGDAAATLETILNKQLNLSVTVKWIAEKRPALVLRGKYKASPKNPEELSGDSATRADGMFEIPVNRDRGANAAVRSMGMGPYEEFLQVIGEALMLPVIDEASNRPSKPEVLWQIGGESASGYSRLDSEHEQLVLKSLHEQLGYDLSIEPREVRILMIEPVAE